MGIQIAPESYLKNERGLADCTITNYSELVRRFLVDRFGAAPPVSPSLSELVSSDVITFVAEDAHGYSHKRVLLMISVLRSFFRYLLLRGEITRNLAGAVPGIADWRLQMVPSTLDSEEVQRLLKTCNRASGTGRRDYAILLLLAREYDSRFRGIHGKLRNEAQNAFLNFRRCGDPNFGVTLFRCDTCDINLGVPFTCKARVCPSLARKAETRAMHLSEVLPEVEHRHLVFGLPKKMGLRQRIQEDPKLLRKVTRLVNQTITEHLLSCVRIHRNRKDELEGARPGMHTWADNLDYHPHLHLCITDVRV